MRVIGITGPSGSGKSVLTKHLASRGYATIDADALYHSMLVPPSECLDALRIAFGDGIFSSDGTLDRRALAQLVFSDGDKLSLLNSTVLGIVIARIRLILAELESNGATVAIVDAPTLIESGFDKECDLVISVISPKDVRISRISERDGIDTEHATARIRAQKDDDFYRSASDFVLVNDAGLDALKTRIAELCELCGL